MVMRVCVDLSHSGGRQRSSVCALIARSILDRRTNAETLFQPGNPGGPGRSKNSRNALSEAFLSALHDDFKIHGAAAIEGARAESPLGYVRMVAGLLPQKLQVESGAGGISDPALLATIRTLNGEPESQSREIDGAVH